MMISVTASSNSQPSSALATQMDVATGPNSPRSPLEHDVQPLSEEPPMSLKANAFGGLHDLIASSKRPLIPPRRMAAYEQRTTMSLPNDFATAGLTACSLNTMQQEYDKDTWRMYERIQAARNSQGQNSVYSYVCDAVEEVNYEDFSTSRDTYHPPCVSEEDYGGETEDAEGIFELDF